jgi:hypothetical protein
MPTAKRRVMAVQPHEVPPVQATPAPQRRVGRPPGEASTIVNIRLPLSLVARLDDYLDRLEEQTGLKAGVMKKRVIPPPGIDPVFVPLACEVPRPFSSSLVQRVQGFFCTKRAPVW